MVSGATALGFTADWAAPFSSWILISSLAFLPLFLLLLFLVEGKANKLALLGTGVAVGLLTIGLGTIFSGVTKTLVTGDVPVDGSPWTELYANGAGDGWFV